MLLIFIQRTLNLIPPTSYNNVLEFLYDIADTYKIQIVEWIADEKYNDIKVMYEKILLHKDKNKSDTAIRNDVNQVITLMQTDTNADLYFATWDTSIYLLRDKVLDTINYGTYHYFNIYNPAKLSNKIALENFNIDESALTNEIFAYADKKYDISNRVKSLIEIIAPFLKDSGSDKLLRKLARLRKTQLQDSESMRENSNEDKNLPIEEVVMLLIPDKERIKQNANIIDKFSLFMSMEENADYIIDIVTKVSKLKDYKLYDFSEYFEKINSIDLSNLVQTTL